MLLVFLYIYVVQVLSDVPPPPLNVHVDKWQMKWTAATEKNDNYSVQYCSFQGVTKYDVWEFVPGCQHISSHSCDISFTKALAEHGCVMLQVQAERNSLVSIPVEACGSHGGSCTPEIRLVAGPGSLTAHLNRDHDLFHEYGGHLTHKIYFGKEGDPLEERVVTASSETFVDLQEGQRYCAKVQYLVFDKQIGLPSCTKCEVVPVPDTWTTVKIAVGVVLFVIVIIGIPVIAYVLIFHHRSIKKWLQPPYDIPKQMILEPLHVPHGVMLIRIPSEEHCDVIFNITPLT